MIETPRFLIPRKPEATSTPVCEDAESNWLKYLFHLSGHLDQLLPSPLTIWSPTSKMTVHTFGFKKNGRIEFGLYGTSTWLITTGRMAGMLVVDTLEQFDMMSAKVNFDELPPEIPAEVRGIPLRAVRKNPKLNTISETDKRLLQSCTDPDPTMADYNYHIPYIPTLFLLLEKLKIPVDENNFMKNVEDYEAFLAQLEKSRLY